LFISLFF
jgi:hypothetical protein